MTIKQWWRARRSGVLALPIYCIARGIGMTLRLRAEGYDELQARPESQIYAGWHGKTFIAATLFRKKGVWTIISQSNDGDMQNRIFRRFGFNTVRGSTGRGGVKALIECIRILKQGAVMAFTPDGPRGPSGVVQEGIMLMAQKSGALLVPVGVSARWKMHAPTWDRYMVPFPFSRAIMIFGKPIHVPTEADAEQVEAYRQELEREIHRLEKEADERMGHKR